MDNTDTIDCLSVDDFKRLTGWTFEFISYKTNISLRKLYYLRKKPVDDYLLEARFFFLLYHFEFKK